jgi:transposase-like protein
MSKSSTQKKTVAMNCPSCDADVAYRYGHTKAGKQRFMCLMCGMQFSLGAQRAVVDGKPSCPDCGKSMNIYKLEGHIIRFRCSGYPRCKAYRKFTMSEEPFCKS